MRANRGIGYAPGPGTISLAELAGFDSRASNAALRPDAVEASRPIKATVAK